MTDHPDLKLWKALRTHHTEAEAAHLMEGFVRLGELSGWSIGIMRRHEHAGGDTLALTHRCGWAQPLPTGTDAVGITAILDRRAQTHHTCAARPVLEPIRAEDCTGPHICRNRQLSYCRESCTMCAGIEAVRACFNHGNSPGRNA